MPRSASLAPLVHALSSLLGVGGGIQAVLEILLALFVFAMELARLNARLGVNIGEHTLNARRREAGRPRNWRAILARTGRPSF